MIALPIRLRLTLWYFVMFASAAACLCSVSLWMLRLSADASEYHDLQERAEDVELILQHEPPEPSVERLRAVFAYFYGFKDDGEYLRIRDEQGNWLFRSSRLMDPLPAMPPPNALPAQGQLVEFQQGRMRVRALFYAIQVHGRRYTVQTGLKMNRTNSLLSNFRTKLLLLAPAMILLAALGGHFMSRKALRPVGKLAEEARRIDDRRLDIRLPVTDSADEISHLTTTLNQMLARIDKAFSSVRAFTGSASHELRTPVALMRTEIEVTLLRPRTTEEYQETLRHLHEETLRMTSLVENLLSLARADGGADVLRMKPVRVDTLFEHVERNWREAMSRAALELQIVRVDSDVSVLGDAESLQRLVSILMDNACKYTAAGGRVVLAAEREANALRISVSDNGAGIAAEDLPFLFDRFYRGRHLPAHAPSGSGLGLSLAKWMAEQQHSTLEVRSEVGQGSVFSLLLPIVGKQGA